MCLYFSALRTSLFLNKCQIPFGEMDPKTSKECPHCFTVPLNLLLLPDISNFNSSVQTIYLSFHVFPHISEVLGLFSMLEVELFSFLAVIAVNTTHGLLLQSRSTGFCSTSSMILSNASSFWFHQKNLNTPSCLAAVLSPAMGVLPRPHLDRRVCLVLSHF